MGYVTTFLRSQLFVTLPYPNSDLSGQVIVVTGSNTGLGFEAARHFLRLNAAKVILAVRSIAKGEIAAKELLATTKRLQDALKLCNMDRLDAFVQNAGILTYKWILEEGEESTITVNVTGATLLCLSVLPKLRESASKHGTRGRFTFVGSDLQYIAKFKESQTNGTLFDALNDKESADMDDRYRVSKLLLLYVCRTIAEQSPVSEQSNVIINYLTPGACHSDIFRDPVSLIQTQMMGAALALIARSTEVGSRALVDAVKPDIDVATHGAFLMDCKVFPNGENVESAHGQKMQMKFTQELWAKLEGICPGVTRV